MRKLKILTAILAFCICFGVCAFAENKSEKEIEIDLSVVAILRSIDGEATKDEIKINEIKGLSESKDSPAIFFGAIPEIPTDTYRYIVMEMKSDITLSDKGYASHAFYFRTDENPTFAESRKCTIFMTLKSDDYVEYIFDMGSNDDWKGVCTGIFYSFGGDVFGSASIKSIKFIEGEKMKKLELSEEEKLTDLPQPERKIPVSDFKKTRDYGKGFDDVKAKDWFFDSVESAYEYGFVNGVDDKNFNPTGEMTVAEAITLACRMHGAQKNDAAAENIPSSTPWYEGYVDYAVSEGFLEDGEFDSYTRPIKRYEMVSLFAHCLPTSVFEELNYITHIPDVSKSEKYAEDVFMFYNAGICLGSDIYGTFNPESNIKRSEVAAIVSRIADLDKRIDGELAVKTNSESAFWIVDDTSTNARNTVSMSTQSGWDYDIRGGTPKDEDEPPYSLTDVSDTEPVTLTRHLTLQDSGKVTTAPASLKFVNKTDGWYMTAESDDGLAVYKLYTDKGEFYVLDNGTPKATGVKVTVGNIYYIKIITDIDRKTNTYLINEENLGTYGFSNAEARNMLTYKQGTTAEAKGNFTMGVLKMHANYLVNEYIQSSFFPYDWNVEKTGDVNAAVVDGEFVFSGNGGKATLKKSFEKANDKISADYIVLFPTKADGFSFAITSGEKNAIEFSVKDGKMYSGDKLLRECTDMMWYMIRVEADTRTQTAKIKVSGKTVAENVPFANKADYFDGISFTASELNDAKVRIDDITVEPLPEYDNYPSEPKVPEGADDYYIGMNICNLWRNGQHWGWDNISPYDENKPLLGFYDEGLTEVSDWEIKFMAEHGIDFQLVCWYHSAENPMKTFYSSTPNALFRGFMNAKYSDDYGKFALLWEAANGQRPKDLEDFKERFCNFWFEYFFSDPRYMVIDNKLVMSIFGADKLTSSFGSAAGVKEAFDYLEERVKSELGYDGIIIMACSGSSETGTLNNLANMGIDAVHAYNWGNTGYLATVNQNSIANQQKNGRGIIHNVPTVSTGFNNIAWAYTRHPLLTVENMEQVLLWIRDSALGKFKITGDGDEWKQKTLILSTWNEYGEGTYMMPSGLNGFGYLDAVRRVFTKGGDHEDERPDNIQSARLGHLYPINREIIRPEGYKDQSDYTEIFGEESFTSGWKASSCSTKVEGDLLVGKSTNSDPILISSMPNGIINANEVKTVKVWVDGPVGNSVEVFFLTEDDQNWTASKGTRATITKSGLNPVTVDMTACATWKGNITAIRIDPITSENEFKLQKVQYLGEKQTEKLFINGNEFVCYIQNVQTENDILVPFYPDTGIGYSLGCKYEWDKQTKKLTLTKNGVELVFTMGSNRIIVNGEPECFEHEIYLEDGIPMVPIKYISEKFGFISESKTEDGIEIFSIITVGKEYYDVISSRKNNQWEFDIDGDIEGFGLQGCAVTVEDGAVKGTATLGNNGRYDAAISSPELSVASTQYTKLKIRMKHDITVEKTDANKGEMTLVVYFASSAGGLSESRTFKKSIEQSSNGEFVEYVFDVSEHKDWTGKITKIRIDPFNNVPGSFEIDYVRFE